MIEKYVKKDAAENAFTNVYIKNFPSDVEESYLKGLLEKYGEVNSFFLPRKENGELKGFAFCNFVDTAAAKKAIAELHDKKVFEMAEPIYVQRAQPKMEREAELRAKVAKLSLEGKPTKKNFYITNIPSEYGEEEIKEVFGKYGTVTSCAVNRDNKIGENTNFAYVCFSTAEEAAKLLEDAPNVSLDGKKLSISLFKSKVERRIEKEREAHALLYSPKVINNSRGNGERKDGVVDKRIYDDIFKTVYSMAPSYERNWGNVNASTRKEFTEKVTALLLKKTKPELRNMIELSSVLVDSVSSIVKCTGCVEEIRKK
jgi:polyadenylate-binding protein